MEIKNYLKYDPTSKTGLRWIQDKGKKVKAGQEAFTTIKGDGYYGGGFDSTSYFAHQIIMFLEEGKWSDRYMNIHHKDENKLNNNLSNLELISRSDHNRIHLGRK